MRRRCFGLDNFRSGQFFESGLDVPEDLEKAAVLHERAAEGGDIDATVRLCCMTSSGWGMA